MKRTAWRRSLALVAVAATVPLVACIFDSGGDYQGGGRRSDTPVADDTSSATIVPTSTSTSTSSSSGGRDSGSSARDAATDA